MYDVPVLGGPLDGQIIRQHDDPVLTLNVYRKISKTSKRLNEYHLVVVESNGVMDYRYRLARVLDCKF